MGALQDSNGELTPQKKFKEYFDGNGGETAELDGLIPGTQYRFQIGTEPSTVEGGAIYNEGYISFTAVDGLTTIKLNYSGGGEDQTTTFDPNTTIISHGSINGQYGELVNHRDSLSIGTEYEYNLQVQGLEPQMLQQYSISIADATYRVGGITDYYNGQQGNIQLFVTPTEAGKPVQINVSFGAGARSLAARPLAAPRTLANPPLRALANTTWTNDTTGLPEGADPDKDELVDSVTFSGEIWSKTWDDLPKYADDGGEYVYYAYETAYTGATGASALNTTYIIGENGRLIVTNTPTYPDTFELTVLKVDEKDQSRKLPGAEFELNKLVYNSETNRISYVDNSSVTVTTANGGTAVFSDLTVGYYEIKEVKSPDGYIIRGDSTFYIKATGAGIQLVIREDGKAPEEWNTAETSGNVTLEALGTTTATATVTNEPGVALPSTGGPGTRLFTILGSILILGAGVLLWRRRKLI